MATSKTGRKARMYYNAGTHASPSWVEITRAGDVSVALGKEQVELKDRGSDWKKDLAGHKELSISFDLTYLSGANSVYAVMLDSYVADTPVEFAVMDGDITVSGTAGWRAYCTVFGFEKSEEQGSAMANAVELHLTEFEEAAVIVEPDHYIIP